MDVSQGSNVKLVWIGYSALGAVLGSILAVHFFPSAGFGKNPTGVYGPNVFGFAFLNSAPIATAQLLALRWILSRLNVPVRQIWIWVSVSLLGWMATVLPLWSVSVEVFMLPISWVVMLIPGTLVLGLMQRSYLARDYTVSYWVTRTVVGASLGSLSCFVLLFLWFSLGFGSVQFLNFETLWAALIVIGVSALQCTAITNICPKRVFPIATPPEY